MKSVEILLELGANTYIKDVTGRNAKEIAEHLENNRYSYYFRKIL